MNEPVVKPSASGLGIFVLRNGFSEKKRVNASNSQLLFPRVV